MIKKHVKLKSVFLLILILVIFQCTLDTFLDRQYQTTFISNHLRSVNHVTLPADLNDSIIKELKDDYWKMQEISTDQEERVFAFLATNYNQVNLPISNGDFFQVKDSNEAIVGKNVKYNQNNDDQWLVINNKKYKVIGQIGDDYDSVIDDYILLNDASLFNFTMDGHDITLDSIHNKMLDSLLYQKAIKRNNIRVEKWFDLSTFNKLINYNGLFLILLISFLIVYIFYNKRKELIFIKYELGVSMMKIFYKELLILSGLLFMSWFIECLYNKMLDHITYDMWNINSFIYVKYLIILFSFVILFFHSLKKGLSNV